MSNFCTLSQAKPNEQDPFKIPAYTEYPKLRLGTQLDAIYERLYRDGYGILQVVKRSLKAQKRSRHFS